MIAFYRTVLGDAAVDAKIAEAGKDISADIAGGGKETFCDSAKNIDMGLPGGNELADEPPGAVTSADD